VAAASEGRTAVAPWDLWLLPWCVAPSPERQAAIDAWLTARLGLEAAMAPPLLTRVVEAFEAQAALEQEAEDLDYDESGRLRFSADLDANVNDAKGASQAVRMSYRRKRRYGDIHIGARVSQVDELNARIASYAEAIAANRAGLADYAQQGIWIDREFAARADANLAATIEAIDALRLRAAAARHAFTTLPRREVDTGSVPDPVTVADAPV
jgi:MoxR-like ATPase